MDKINVDKINVDKTNVDKTNVDKTKCRQNKHNIMDFTKYLQQKKLSAATIKNYTTLIQHFIIWLNNENLTNDAFTYNDVLAYMQVCKDKKISIRSTQMLLGVTRHYCNYLIQENKRTDNPAAGIFIKGLVRKLPSNLLTTEALENLYKQYNIKINIAASKKIMLGLLIYQGLKVAEIINVQAKHIQLDEAKIFIPGTKRGNERWLNLQATQMNLLQEYLQQNKHAAITIFTAKNNQPLNDKNINNRLQYIFLQLKQLNKNIINAKQIRSSVITAWLKNNNLRQVQYMAGHKYVSSTERYQTTNLEALQNELQQHHPMR